MRAPLPELAVDVVGHPDGDGDALLVLLHGYAEPSSSLTDRLGLIDPHRHCTTVVPEAPFEHRGAAIWHRALVTAPLEALEQFDASLHLLDELLGRLVDQFGTPLERVVVGGFSQGGGLALGLLLSADVEHRPAGGFGVCSFPPAFPGFRASRSAARGRPFLLASARRDHFAPIEASRGGAATLVEMGVALTYLETDGEHVMSDEAAVAVGDWLPGALDGTGEPAPSPHLAGVDTREGFYADLWDVV